MKSPREIITASLKKATGLKKVVVENPAQEGHGDYSTNIALVAFSSSWPDDSLARIQNPRSLAESIVQKLSKDKELNQIVSKIEIAGPGFINFFLSQETNNNTLQEVLDKQHDFGKSDVGQGKSVVIDYSAPNIAKHFSVGHLRSTIIGQALYNLYTALGYKVIGDNHLGDWGTQFGMILAAISINNLDINKLTVNDLEELYVDYSDRAKKEPALRDKAKMWFKKLEEGDNEARTIWQAAWDASMAEYNRIYELLDVKIDETLGESFYEDKMDSVISEAKKKDIAHTSEGALVMSLGNEMPPGMLLKSDGTTTYFTRDLATIKFRLETWEPSLIIYEVGAEQALHFRQVFAAARKFGWADGLELIHVAHGLFLLDGKKMSTRGGTTIKLEDLLQKSIEKARQVMNEAQVAKDMSAEEKNNISKQVGIGAVIYFDLKHAPTSNINFQWGDVLSMEGNSGPYIQYTYARTQSVLRKSKTPDSKFETRDETKVNEEELAVLRILPKFPEVVVDAATQYSPHFVSSYLYDLSQKYNTFYNKHSILEPESGLTEEREFRIALTQAVGQVIKNGLDLLGIAAPERM